MGVQSVNPGACTGPWIETTGAELVSVNPANDEPIAAVRQATAEEYEQVVVTAQGAFESWRMVPAPQRGEIVRQLGEEFDRGGDTSEACEGLEDEYLDSLRRLHALRPQRAFFSHDERTWQASAESKAE